jgi:hypothetical protein
MNPGTACWLPESRDEEQMVISREMAKGEGTRKGTPETRLTSLQYESWVKSFGPAIAEI